MAETGCETRRFSIKWDSALIVAVASALLYFFGIAFRIIRLNEIGVPVDFARQWSLQEYVLSGGVFLAILAPFLAFPDLALAMWPTGRQRLLSMVASLSLFRALVLSVYAVFLGLIIIFPIARLLAHTSTHYRVSSIVLKSGKPSALLPQNAYYVSGTEKELVFVDKWADPRANLIIIARDEVAELQLRRETARRIP